MLRFLCILLLSSSLALAGCATRPPPQPTLAPDVTQLPITKLWDSYVGFGPSFRDYRYRPAQDDTWVYAIGKQGVIYRARKDNGRREVVVNIKQEITGGVSLVNQLLLLGTIEGTVLAYALDTNELQWEVALGSEILHPPVSDGKLVVVKTNNGQLWGISLATGTIVWTSITNNPALSTRSVSEPLLAAGVIFSSFDTGKVAVINPQNGVRLWETSIGESDSNNDIQRINDSDTAPVFASPNVYTANLHGAVSAFRLASDQLPSLLWSTPFSTANNIVLFESSLYIFDDQSSLFALDTADGSQQWKNDQLKQHKMGQLLLWQGYLFSGSYNGYIYAFAPESGALVGMIRVSPYAISSSLIADSQRLYVQDDGGYLHALELTQPLVSASKGA